MVAKLAAVILAIGILACALLAVRQMRTQAAHELAETRLRIMQRDNQLWRVRTQIAEAVAPQRVQALAATLSPLTPLTPELAAKPVPAEVADAVVSDEPTSPTADPLRPAVPPRVAGVPALPDEPR